MEYTGARFAGEPLVRIAPNLFGIAFRLSGLSEVWNDGRPLTYIGPAMPNGIAILPPYG